MRNPEIPASTLEALLVRPGTLAVVRQQPAGTEGLKRELFLAVLDDGRVIGFNSHVDLGTGIRTSLSQIVADELDADIGAVFMMLGDTAWVPDQGPTIASETIQVTAIPLRQAAATARQTLMDLAAARFGVARESLGILDGEVFVSASNAQRARFADLVADQTIVIEISENAPLKAREDYRFVGRSQPRVDIEGKARGDLVFVHDVRLPGMLHGRVVRPPYAGRDVGAFIGNTLSHVDRESVAHVPGIVAVVVEGDFVGVVAEREEQAEEAARTLHVEWREFPDFPPMDSPEQAIRDNPRETRRLIDDGDVDGAIGSASTRLTRTYVWPYQMHASIGPCCSVAAFDEDGRLTVWSGTQTQHMLRADLASLLDMPETAIDIIRMEASGSYGRSGMDDVGADAALLARAAGRPVRVQLSREQEHLWEPKGTGQLMEVDGGIDADGAPVGYDYQSSYPSNISPTLALLLTGRVSAAIPIVHPSGDRTARPPYAYPTLRVQIHDMAPIARAAFFRGVSALPTSFAHESYIDELASAAGVDPVEYRLRYLPDERAANLVRSVAEKSGWVPRTAPRREAGGGTIVKGQGFAYAVYVHGSWPGTAAAWAAWTAEVDVDLATGEVAVTRVVAGQDSGAVINPDGVRHQIHGNVIQATSRALKERVEFDRAGVASREWGSYPLLRFPEVPKVEIVVMQRPDDPPLGVGESASVPSAAAIANAVYDATGVRFRELPLTPDRVLAELAAHGVAAEPARLPGPGYSPTPKRAMWWRTAAAGFLALATAGTILWPFKPSIAPIPKPEATIFTEATIARGRQLAEAGDCAVCHTAAGGPSNAGGFPIETPFGTVYSTNITPDPESGIGSWSYPAFERAMREGISRDGRHLYPAFPYTSFTKMSDADLQALYAFLMSEPAVRYRPAETKLAFPFNLRPALAAWNGLYLEPGAYKPDAQRSADWNRGAYLVESVGHCSACHSPRDALGGERQGDLRWAGGTAEGWDAPPLGVHSRAPIMWSESELFTYLRTGASDLHGPAAGAMQPIIHGLGALPDADIRAMAVYLRSLSPDPVDPADPASAAVALARSADARLRPLSSRGSKLFDGACAACHTGSAPHMFGARLPLALNSNVHADRPDNLIRIILEGYSNNALGSRGAMPAFGDSLDDGQIASLVGFIRETQAPDRPAWTGVGDAVARVRKDSAAFAKLHRSASPESTGR